MTEPQANPSLKLITRQKKTRAGTLDKGAVTAIIPVTSTWFPGGHIKLQLAPKTAGTLMFKLRELSTARYRRLPGAI